MQGIDRANEMLSAQLNSVSGLLCHTGMGCVHLLVCLCVCVCVCARASMYERESECVSGMSRRHMSHSHYTLLHRSQDLVEEDKGGGGVESHVTCLIKP